MRLRQRSFPHPVVGNADDVPGAGFQATYDVESDRKFYYITVSIACGSPSLTSLIEERRACSVLHVECGTTMYRRAFDVSEQKQRFMIPGEQLHGSVELNVFARALYPLESYAPAGAHPDYGTTTFRVEPCDILAIADGYEFTAESEHDSLGRIGSIMVVEQSTETVDYPMQVALDSNKIRILLSEHDFALYGKLKAIPHLTGHITTTIVLPALMSALTEMDKNDDDFKGLNWCKSLKRRIETLGCVDGQDSLIRAQKILELPIRRAFAEAESYLLKNDT